MREEEGPGSVRNDLLERLKALEGPQSSGSLAEIAYRRAREALERALEEARSIRLQAIDDARATREHELNALMDSMRQLRLSAQAQIDDLLRTAEIESTSLREQAKSEAQTLLERASDDAERIRAEAAAVRAGAEARVHEVDLIEQEFERLLATVAKRLGIETRPAGGWWRRLVHHSSK